MKNQNEWDLLNNLAAQKLPNNFAAATVLRAQNQRYADRRRNTMVAVCCACILSVLGTMAALNSYQTLNSENQWQQLYVENEIMRTSI